MNVVMLGATKGMGRALARDMAMRGDRLFLLGRDLDDMETTRNDLRVRSGQEAVVGTVACDLAEPEGFAAAFDAAFAALERVDTVVLTAGILADQQTMETDPQQTAELLKIDFSSAILFCEEARRRLLAQGGGTLCAFSSVAGDRARKPTILYGATKAGLSYYLEGLDHKFRGQGLRTICVKPGFVHTGMTAGLKPPPFAGQPEQVARDVLRAIDRGRPVVYTPRIWGWVMAVIKRLPRAVMRRIGF